MKTSQINILGLHFGHDASISVIQDGNVLICTEVERHNRLKHSIGLVANDISRVLDNLGINLGDIDLCTITSTQQIEYIFSDPSKLRFKIVPQEKGDDHLYQFTLDEKMYLKEVLDTKPYHVYLKRLTEELRQSVGSRQNVSSIEDFFVHKSWKHPRTLEELAHVTPDLSDKTRFGFQLPVCLTIFDHEIPGYLFSHHYAHAAYAFYTSNFNKAAILTQDGSLPGSSGYLSGMFYWGEGEKLYPIAPHYLTAGNLYERVAYIMGLGMDTGAGKLMGLAPYGNPRFYSEKFIGNFFDGKLCPVSTRHQLIPEWLKDEKHPLLYRWLNHCLWESENSGYDLSAFGNPERILEPVNVDIAASTQKLIEETLLRAVAIQEKLFTDNDLKTDGFTISGGVALNCPANSRIFCESAFKNLYIPPAVHDGGLSIGSALAAYYNILANKRVKRDLSAVGQAFLGVHRSFDELSRAAENFVEDVFVEYVNDAADMAAQLLAENKIIAWFEGRSEIGPRALGHRSILCHPGYIENWLRINLIKGREHWRPLAPSVLEEKASEYFENCPIPSPFMLINARVKRTNIPAVTHVDGSARIQTVGPSLGDYYKIIKRFFYLTGIPVILNTSFNGPGEPVIETGKEAIKFLLKSKIDALMGPGIIIKRKS